MIYITFEYVITVHDKLIDEYGGLKGILNEGMLRSALEMPKASFGGRSLHRTLFDKAAAYLFHLIQNHPFVDGNKRTAAMVALTFLISNFKGILSVPEDPYQELILRIAQGCATKKQIASFFKSSSCAKNPQA